MTATIQHCPVTQPGPPDVVTLTDAPASELTPGSVRVAIRAAAVNFRDVHTRRSSGTGEHTFPGRARSDFAGVITEVAPDVHDDRLRPGARVVGFATDGAYATEVVVPALVAHPLPDTIDDVLASTLPVAGLTASLLCSSAGVGPGTTVVTWAAAGGLGCYLGALADHLGAVSIGITSSPEKVAVARAAGHHHVVSHRDGDVVAAIWDHAAAGADVDFDSVGGPGFRRSFLMAADHGQVVLCGRAAGEPDLATVAGDLIGARRNLALRDFSLMGHLVAHLAEVPDRLDQLIEVVPSRPDVIPVTTYPLSGAADAHAALEAGRSIGKLVLVPDVG